jgi:dethiobiotin synthetase
MSKGFFITGTGTEVGKTIFTAGLACWLKSNGLDVIPMKPIQTGAQKTLNGWIAPDLDYVLKIADIVPPEQELGKMRLFCYELACSPHLAARLAGGKYPKIQIIKNNLVDLQKNHDIVFVEGAGGIFVPINQKLTMLDLMKELDLPVILVATSSLGTLNHTLLSVLALKSRGIKIAGFILNDITPVSEEDKYIREDNVRTLIKFSKEQYLGTLPYIPKLTRKNLINVFEKNLEKGIRETLEI